MDENIWKSESEPDLLAEQKVPQQQPRQAHSQEQAPFLLLLLLLLLEHQGEHRLLLPIFVS